MANPSIQAQGTARTDFLSLKMRFWSFASMVLLAYVHGYNLREGYLQPFTTPGEPLTFTTFWEYFLANGILRFRIPMLFAISGYLYALGDAVPNRIRFVKRLRTLGIPYLAWAGLSLSLTALLEWASPQSRQAVVDAHLGWFGDRRIADFGPGNWLLVFTIGPIAYQLWFLRVLLVLNLAYPLLLRGLQHWPRTLFWVFGVLWVLQIEFPFFVPEGILAFMVGVWYAKGLHRSAGKTMMETGPPLIPAGPPWGTRPWHWMAAWVGLSTIKTWLAIIVPFAGTELALLLLHKATVLVGLVAAWYGLDGLVRACMAQTWFRWGAAFSFFIYAAHAPVINYATKWLVPHIAYLPNYRLASYLLLPGLVVLACIAVGAILRTLAPPIYKTLTGGRGI